jgi:hypothetical protein
MTTLAWGARVSAAFRSRVQQIAAGLGCDPSWLMAVMDQESSLNPAARNPSGAIGLIQFMPQTAAALGVSTEALAAMSAEAQLEEVAAYFRPWTGRLHNLGDTYSVVLWPGMLGKPDAYIVFDKADPHHPARYLENKGLDLNTDGKITRGEVCQRVQSKLDLGLRPGNVWVG